jgi:hypothetical protein
MRSYDISKHVVLKAFQRVKANKGAAGIDNESLDAFEADLKNNLYKIWNRMCSGSYFPPPVKAVEIPKKNGGKRILGVPTVADRVAQMVTKIYFEHKVEPIFHQDSYGYRPEKSAIDALAVTRQRCWQYDWVLEFDIKGLFFAESLVRFWPIYFFTMLLIRGWSGTTRANRLLATLMMQWHTATPSRVRRCFLRASSFEWRSVSWNSIRIRPVSFTVMTVIDGESTRRPALTFWGTRFAPDCLRTHMGSSLQALLRQSATQQRSICGRLFGDGACSSSQTRP